MGSISLKEKNINGMSFTEIAKMYGNKPKKYKDNFNITNDNIEQILETIGEEVKGLSKDEFNEEENSYYENLYKESVGLKI